MAQPRQRGKLEPVGPLLGELLHGLGLDTRLREFRAVEVWDEVVGATIAAHAHAVAIREGVLFVEVESSVWTQELGLLREQIVEQLNANLGAKIVRRIVLTLERGPSETDASPHREG
ncbi:MAG: DUF721 domain-containing protein [Candidatus Latescibacterota bacterium]|nr:MAG: DUF721 domain-containing protein [Candidatus Latescibacterota bacterium]